MKRTWSEANAEEFGQLGIIESVKLRNFMCHDNLSFDFDPHMNFIVGLNGSGKSAVLTGIILALGGKSGATGRYSNIKGFVKTGKNAASVSVTLKNCGPDAFKPDDYGNAITVERHFTAEGVSSYKLKSSSGRIVSYSKEELTNILNVMDIQIENPITVLTQEISRNFLNSKNSKAEKLFQLFYRGTGLSKVHEDYNRAVQQKEDARSELENKKVVLPDMEKDIKTLKALLNKKSKLVDLNKELCWAMVIEREKERNTTAESVNKLKKKVSDLTNKLNMNENELAAVDQSIAVAETDKKTSYTKMDDIRKRVEEMTNKKQLLRKEFNEVQGTYSRNEREVKNIDSQIAGLENMMHEIQMKNESDVQEDKLRHEVALKNLHDQITNTEAALGLLETRKNKFREEAEGLYGKLETCQAEIQEINYDENRIRREKQQLIDGMQNRLNVFGPEMIKVLREIRAGFEAGIFKQEPKGPIGRYINVKQPEWNFAVQECLKPSLLKTFLCDNHADADQLTKIFLKYFPRHPPSIITSKFVSKVYDVSAHECLSQYPTLLDMITVEDPAVANCLIDQKQIENILLIANPVEARDLMLYNAPNKCSYAYALNGDQFCHSPFRKYACRNNRNQVPFLKTVNKDDIRAKDEEMTILRTRLSAKTSQKETLVQKIKANEREIEKSNSEITDMKLKRKDLHMKLRDENLSYSEPKDINCLATDLEELKKDKALHEEELTVCRKNLNSKQAEYGDLDQNCKEGQRILTAEAEKYSLLSAKVQDCQSRKETLDCNIKKIKSELQSITPDLQNTEKSLADNEATVQTFLTQALNACPDRIDTTRSSDEIRQHIKELRITISQQKERNRQSVLEELENKVESLRKAKTELQKLEKILERLDKMMTFRFQEFQKICKNTSVSLTCTFTTYLKENNFSGFPDVSFEARTLEIIAKPDKIKSKHGSKTNLAQLSGGEKSYVTIAFLLSLWDRIHSPFRILDEYDVFMDSNNRHRSIHLLINSAKSNKKIQYIFLSPLELPPIEDISHVNVKVHKMPAPRK